jgi:hypothetical protein
MQSIVIEPKNEKEFSFIREMLRKLNIKMKIIKPEEMDEDIALGNAIEEGLKSKKVSKQTVLKSLKK